MSKLTVALDQSLTNFSRNTFLKQQSACAFGELGRYIYALSNHFLSNGLENQRVVLCIKNDIALLSAFFASVRSGITAVVLDPDAPPEELKNLICAADAAGILADSSVVESLENDPPANFPGLVIPVEDAPRVLQQRNWLFGKFLNKDSEPAETGLQQGFWEIVKNTPDDLPKSANPSEDSIAYILFTSGTTSKPKGVMISHKALYAQMQTFIRNYGLDQTSKIMNLLPFHHTDGLTQGATVALLCGATLIRPWTFSVDRVPAMVDALYTESVSHLVTVPSVMALIENLGEEFDDAFQYPEFQFIISTAAYLDPKLWERFEDRFSVQIVNVYGLTETVCETIYCGPSEANRKLGSIGKPIDSEAKIVAEDGRDVTEGGTGELWVRGDHIMSGYFRMPEATSEVLGEDGWFKTGDLARRDEDGFFHIVGRKKDLIITGGMNVYPEDVSTVLRSLTSIVDAVTFGVPDDVWGERTVSCVIAVPESQITKEDIVAQFLEVASKSKLPRELHIVDSFPRGPAGKVVLSEIKAIAAGLRNERSGCEDESADIAERIFAISANVFQTDMSEITLDSNSETTKGWTSLAHVEFLLSIEREFGIKLSAKEIMNLTSIGSAVGIVENLLLAA